MFGSEPQDDVLLLLRTIRESVHSLHRKVNFIMATQDDVNAALTADDTALSNLATRVSGVEQGLRDEITALQAANPGIDTAGLEVHLAELAATADAIDAAVVATPATPAPTVGAPATPAPGATPVTPDGQPTGETPVSAPVATDPVVPDPAPAPTA